MGDENGIAQPLVDRRRGVAHMQHEGASAHHRTVHPGRGDAEVVGQVRRPFGRGGEAVDVRRLQPRVGHRVERGIGVELDLGEVGNKSEFGGFGGTDDRNGFPFHLRHLPV